MVCNNYLNLRVQRLWGRLPRTCSAWKTCSAPWERSRWGTAMCCVTFLKRYSPACATRRRRVLFLPLCPPATALRGRDWTTAGKKGLFQGLLWDTRHRAAARLIGSHRQMLLEGRMRRVLWPPAPAAAVTAGKAPHTVHVGNTIRCSAALLCRVAGQEKNSGSADKTCIYFFAFVKPSPWI